MTRNTRQISWTLLCGVTGAMLMGSAVQAQGPGAPGGPPSGAPGTGDAALSNVTNETTTTTTTTTDVDPVVTDVSAEPLPNTGGAPLLMSLVGSMLAGGAFMLRRKIS